MPAPAPLATIMIVDDTPENLKLLEGLLRDWGYRVRPFPRGALALAAARDDPPDLILLDINMPGLNGYEVCAQLRIAETTREIPVIFLSVLNEALDKVKAFACGGVDYVSKPFQVEEVRARIETHLTIRRLRHELQRHNRHLEDLVRERTRQLADAHDRLAILDAAKSEFLNLISHELRAPLTGVFGVSELLLMDSPATPERRELSNLYDLSRRNMLAILDDALLLTRIDVSADLAESQELSLQGVLMGALMEAQPLAFALGISLPDCPPEDTMVSGNQQLLTKAFTALLQTAARFAAVAAPVRLSVTRTPALVQVRVSATGRTIPPDFMPCFFDVFAVTRSIVPRGDLGLGPPVAQRIIALSGGSVTVQNEEPAGISFTVQLRVPEADGMNCPPIGIRGGLNRNVAQDASSRLP
ncbi:MAG: hybrid sensor histidine kinase/response regulator [Planctomycetota bacterium]|nr:hybrid sensor histidine kinase/response regulator [Planctomycetota bacterium]